MTKRTERPHRVRPHGGVRITDEAPDATPRLRMLRERLDYLGANRSTATRREPREGGAAESSRNGSERLHEQRPLLSFGGRNEAFDALHHGAVAGDRQRARQCEPDRSAILVSESLQSIEQR